MANYFKWGFIAIAAVWAAMIGTMVGFAWNMSQMPKKLPEMERPPVQNTNISIETQEKMEGYWTVAVFGVDARNGNLEKDTRSDMQMVFNINLGTGEMRVVSVYRDTYLKLNKKGRYGKINDAYFLGGPAQAVGAFSENLDLSIDDYAAFSWKAVAEAINLLDGIDVDISHEEFRLINGFITETVESTGIGSHHLKKEGMNHLDGVQAVAYARLRKMDTDFKRTERQRKVADLVIQKAREADLGTLNKVASVVLPQISTSIGMKDIMPLIKNVRRFHLTASEGFPYKVKDAMIGEKDCVVPIDMVDSVKHLHQFLFDDEAYQPSEAVKEIGKIIKSRVNK
jgi:LCP family protein required for cell wall assembly